MAKEVKFHDAKNIYFSTPESSWCSVTYSEAGDFHILSDWGYFSFAWRGFGSDFESFLRSSTPDYLMQKLLSNCNQWSTKVSKFQKKHLENNLFQFINILRDKHIKATQIEQSNQ